MRREQAFELGTMGGQPLVAVCVDGLAAVLPELSPREREIAMLAVLGLANTEIARIGDRSLRTVQNQLAAVYRKLRISGRRELRFKVASALGDGVSET